MIRYSFFLLLVLGLPGVAHAQSLAIELVGGPTMAYRISIVDERLQKVMDEEQPMLSYEAGVRMFYSLKENWRVGGALMYARKGFKPEPVFYTNEFGEPMDDIGSKHVISFLELPVIARYVIKEKNKFSLYAQSGLGASFFLRGRTILEEPVNFNGESIQEYDSPFSFRDVNLAFHAGFGAAYQLGSGWQLGVEPAFNCHILSMFPAEQMGALSTSLFALGLNVVGSYAW